MAPVLIYKHPDFLVIDKPTGLSVHRGAGVKGRTLADWLVAHYPEVKTVGDDPRERPGIVHRLDKDTSGVIVAARNKNAFESLKRLFKERQIEKTYLALVLGMPAKRSGSIDSPIGRLAANPVKRGTGPRTRGVRSAKTEYRILERIGNFSLLAVKPKTGRTHQIRVHLASIGHPVAGDRIYGGTKATDPGTGRQFLHAWRLAFSYPEGRRWQFEAALPQDLQSSLRALRAGARRAKRAE